MNTPDSHDEHAWLNGLGLAPDAGSGSPEVARDAAILHKLLNTLPPEGPVPEPVLKATEQLWLQDTRSQSARAPSAAPTEARRPGSPAASSTRWKLWVPSLVAAASFLLVLLRPLVVETGMHWSATVAASVFKDIGPESHASRQAPMDAWMKQLESAAEAAFREDSLGKEWSVRAALTDDADGTLVLRLALTRGDKTLEKVLEFAGPADGPAAVAARETAVRHLLDTARAWETASVP